MSLIEQTENRHNTTGSHSWPPLPAGNGHQTSVTYTYGVTFVGKINVTPKFSICITDAADQSTAEAKVTKEFIRKGLVIQELKLLSNKFSTETVLTIPIEPTISVL